MSGAQMLKMLWPEDGQDAWWATADRVARGLAADHAARQQSAQASELAQPLAATAARRARLHAPPGWLDSMHGLGWASLCADRAHGGQGQPLGVLCRVLEAVSAVRASAAATVYASAAAHMAINTAIDMAANAGASLAGSLSERKRLMRDVVVDWLAWPAFHDIDEQLWPAVDAQGYLRGQVDMLVGGLHAPWAVLPALLRDQSVGLVLVDLRHPAVSRGAPVATLGLRDCGMADVEFGGVPCELLSTRGHALYATLSGKLAPAAMAMLAGVSRACLEAAMAHAATRRQGGGRLDGWGEVRRLLSVMQERLRVQQGLLHAALSSEGEPAMLNARYAALHAGKLACEQASDGVQVLGGAAYVQSAPPAARLGDAHQLQCLMGGVAWRRQQLMAQAMGPTAV